MRKILLTALIMTLMFSASAEVSPFEMATSCRLTNKTFNDSVSFDFINNEIILNVKIKGNDYRFMFDSYGITTVTPELWNELGIKAVNKVNAQDSQKNNMTREIGVIPECTLGNLHYSNVGVMKMDIANIPGMNCYNIDGVIGPAFMKDAEWTIDYEHQIIIISDTPHPTQWDVPMELSGIYQPSIKTDSLTFYIDTGSNMPIKMNRDFFKRHPKYDTLYLKYGTSSTGGGGYGANDTTLVITVDRLPIAGITLEQPVIDIKNNTSPLLGNALFKFFKLKMDYINRWFALIPTSQIPTFDRTQNDIAIAFRNNSLIIGEVACRVSSALPEGLLGSKITIIDEEIIPLRLSAYDFCRFVFGRNLYGKKITFIRPNSDKEESIIISNAK